MVAFNFNSDFAPPILAGIKRSTIRSTKRCNVGDAMQLYIGQRTKACRKLGDAVCIGTAEIIIGDIETPWVLMVDTAEGENIVAPPLHAQEGFINVRAMVVFFDKQYGLPYRGWLHTWGIINEKV